MQHLLRGPKAAFCGWTNDELCANYKMLTVSQLRSVWFWPFGSSGALPSEWSNGKTRRLDGSLGFLTDVNFLYLRFPNNWSIGVTWYWWRHHPLYQSVNIVLLRTEKQQIFVWRQSRCSRINTGNDYTSVNILKEILMFFSPFLFYLKRKCKYWRLPTQAIEACVAGGTLKEKKI